MSFSAILKTVIFLLPTIVDAIKTVETLFENKGKGSEKKEAIREIMEACFDCDNKSPHVHVKNKDINFEDVWPAISKTIDTTVKVLNTTGVLKK